jgi:hypothetical protein
LATEAAHQARQGPQRIERLPKRIAFASSYLAEEISIEVQLFYSTSSALIAFRLNAFSLAGRIGEFDVEALRFRPVQVLR